MTPDQRKLFEAIGRWILGESPGVGITGTDDEIRCLTEAMHASRCLHDDLVSGDASIDAVMESIERKHRAALEFCALMGFDWPF